MQFIRSMLRFVAFAPIDLKDAIVRLKDGFGNLYGGTTYTPTVGAAGAIATATLVPITPGTFAPTVPVGAHVRFEGDLTKYEITARTLSAGVDEVQSMATSTATGGTFTLGITLPGNTEVDTAAIAYDATSATIQTAVDLALAAIEVAGVAYVAGDLAVTGGPANTTATTYTYSGNSVTNRSIAMMTVDGTALTGGAAGAITQTTSGEEVGSTLSITITPGLEDAVVSGDDITFLPIELEIKIGEGNFTYDENREVVFIRDRGALDTFKEGDEQPMDVAFDFTWEFINAIAGAATPTIEQALKHTGPATTWTNSNVDDPCSPYVLDIEIINAPDCGGLLAEVIKLPFFFYTQLSHDSDAAQVSVTGQCNAKMAVITRSDQY
jgi:hypothetical protein